MGTVFSGWIFHALPTQKGAERARREKLHKARVSKFDRILDKAPAMFSAAQLRVFLRALVSIDPYAFDDVAEHLAANDENNQQTSEEILLSPPSTDYQMTGSPGLLSVSSSPHTHPFHAKAKSTF